MQTSLIDAVAVAVCPGASAAPTLTSLAYAEIMVSERKESVKATGKSLTEATSKHKADASKTKENVKGLTDPFSGPGHVHSRRLADNRSLCLSYGESPHASCDFHLTRST